MQDWSERPRDLTRWILDARTARNRLDPARSYGAFVEREPDPSGRVVEVATLLLTNRECPYRCLMCDLWRNTLAGPTPRGAVVEQIRAALPDMPDAKAIKLYNAGSFFDAKAVPRDDWRDIAALMSPFERVIVESHPRLIDESAALWRDMLPGRLEVAIGLETVHVGVLKRLNKQMTLADFERAVRRLRDERIDVRAFILLRPPFLSEAQGVTWARRSLDFAFSIGVGCCAIVPTRGGNGAMERLAAAGRFAPPTVRSLEAVVEYGLGLGAGIVLADLWDIDAFFDCDRCGPARAERLNRMNLEQRVAPPIACECESPA